MQLKFEEIELGKEITHSVIWLHGLGASGHDFMDVIGLLSKLKNNNIRFIFPHAPTIKVTINNGMVMPAWYDIFDLSFGARQDEAGFKRSCLQIMELINHEHARGIKFENIFLFGFSQGGALALYTGLRCPHRLAGIVSLSAYLPLAEKLSTEQHPSNINTPIFMAHGLADPVVPYVLGQQSKNVLSNHHYSVSWREYSMEHEVSLALLSDLDDWASGIISS